MCWGSSFVVFKRTETMNLGAAFVDFVIIDQDFAYVVGSLF